MRLLRLLCVLVTFLPRLSAQEMPATFQNPVLPGFNPDPSICRVGDDYYLATSSFVWFPGLPVYHSKDLANWRLIGHGIDRPEQIDFTGVRERDGIYAPTIRYHDGVFYLITTATKSGGNFYLTATNPAGPWSDPVWLEDAPGIDPSLFWDEDGTCYYTGNTWEFEHDWPKQCAIWLQELDLEQQQLVGERHMLTYGHANNAAYVEAPHLYQVDDKYVLITAEGGTDQFHAVTVHTSDEVTGPYVANKINPVLTHRHLGHDYPIQAVGHADLVETQNGEWWAVVLGKRQVEGAVPLSRETFLCRVDWQDGTPIFNSGAGKVLLEQSRPNLPWAPVSQVPARDEFEGSGLARGWYGVRTPQEPFYRVADGELHLAVRPEVMDDLVHPSLLIRKIEHHQFTAATRLAFDAANQHEQAGLVVYRNNDAYYALLKEAGRIVLVRKFEGKKEVVAKEPYTGADVCLLVEGNGLDATFSYGSSPDHLKRIGPTQSLVVIAESATNKFNGPGVGMYATSNGQPSTLEAHFDWFTYQAGR